MPIHKVNFRKTLFWFFDIINKRKIKNHLEEIKFINENYNTNEAKNILYKRLSKLLKHTTSTTHYYSNYNGSSKLEDFPIINKNIIRDHFESFQSKLFLNKSSNAKIYTSGSTGTPFSIFFNKNKVARNSADTICFLEKTGFELGSRLFYIRLWDDQYLKSKFYFWTFNIRPHDIFHLNDEDIKNMLHDICKDKSEKGIIAYSSVLDAICKYLDKINSEPLNCNIKSIISISESLSVYARESVKKYFNVNVTSRYSVSELGIVAQQNSLNDFFEINHASYFVEILKINQDVPALKGEVGRVVITDYFNYAMPMIRYDTGDLGSYELKGNVPVLAKVEGRRMDAIYDTNGNLISSHIVHKICLFKGIKQYQLIQLSLKEYLLKINKSVDFYQEDEIIKIYKKYFGSDSHIKIEYVDDIPILSSGKRKKVISYYRK